MCRFTLIHKHISHILKNFGHSQRNSLCGSNRWTLSRIYFGRCFKPYVLLLFVFMSVPIFLFTCLYLDFIYVHTYICVYSYRKPFPAYVLLFFFRRKKHFIQRKFSAGIRPTWSKWTGNSEDSKISGALNFLFFFRPIHTIFWLPKLGSKMSTELIIR